MRLLDPRTVVYALILGLTLTSGLASAFSDDESGSTDGSVVADATAASATVPFSIRSVSATSAFAGGACPIQTCNARSGHCGCETVTGSVIATSIGKATLVANITSDNDASTPTGDSPSECSPADGVMTLTSGSNVINIQLIGNRCTEGGSTTPVVSNMNFTIVPGGGKFSASIGTGSLQFSNVALTPTVAPTVMSGTGVIQIKSGF
jgi:hypothetical protein